MDAETPKPLYRTAGYRICGERAVRVDILERLADLIRPVLAWRETSPGAKPDGALDGRSFLVTGAMTSLTGASGRGLFLDPALARLSHGPQAEAARSYGG